MAHVLDFISPKPEKWLSWKTALGAFPILIRYPSDEEVKAAVSRYLRPDRITGGSVDLAEQSRWVASLIKDWRIITPDATVVPCTPDNRLYLVEQNRDLRGWLETQAMSADAFRGEANGALDSSTTGSRSVEATGTAASAPLS